MSYRIQIRRDTTTNWVNRNPILVPGEMGLDTDLNQWKIGDGATPWNNLNYYSSAGGTTNVTVTGGGSGTVDSDWVITYTKSLPGKVDSDWVISYTQGLPALSIDSDWVIRQTVNVSVTGADSDWVLANIPASANPQADSDWVLRQIPTIKADSDWINRQIPTIKADSDWINRQIPTIKADSDWVQREIIAALSATNSYVLDSDHIVSIIQDSDLDMGTNKIKYSNMFATLADLPSASAYHGMFAHVHATGKAYYAHNGNWIRLSNYDDLAADLDIKHDSDWIVRHVNSEIDLIPSTLTSPSKAYIEWTYANKFNLVQGEPFAVASSSTGTINYASNGPGARYFYQPTGNLTINFTGVSSFVAPNASQAYVGETVSYTFFINQGATPRSLSVQIDGVAQTPIYPNGTAPTYNANALDIITVSIVRWGNTSYHVLMNGAKWS